MSSSRRSDSSDFQRQDHLRASDGASSSAKGGGEAAFGKARPCKSDSQLTATRTEGEEPASGSGSVHGYEVTSESIAELYEQLQSAQSELRTKSAKCDKLTKIQRNVDNDIHELTEHLFQQAYKMAGQEAAKKEHAVKLLNEANMKMDVLQAEVAMLKQLMKEDARGRRNVPPSSPTTADKLKQRFFPDKMKRIAPTDDGAANKSALQPPVSSISNPQVDPVYHRELMEWRCHHDMSDTPSNAFVHRLYEEEIRPSFNFDNRQLTEQLLIAAQNNTVCIESHANIKPIIRMLDFRANLATRERCSRLVDPSIDVVHVTERRRESWGGEIVSGHLISPMLRHTPQWVPPPLDVASFELVTPDPPAASSSALRPLVIHLAGTGDHGLSRRRRFMALPLAKEHGIASIILENPFYGTRKPTKQFRSSLLHVTDLFVMGGCLMLECSALLHWAKAMGYGPLGITGISLGGHMASLAGTVWPEPCAIIPCLSWTSAATTFTTGVLADAIPWKLLEDQFFEHNYEELLDLGDRSPMEGATVAFDAGASFMRAQSEHSPDTSSSPSHILGKLRQLVGLRFGVGGKVVSPSRRQVTEFMRGVMDEFTHMSNFSVPVDPSLVICVLATADAYIPRNDLCHLRDVWGDKIDVRYVQGGHVMSYIFKQPDFRLAIRDALQLTAEKHYNSSIQM